MNGQTIGEILRFPVPLAAHEGRLLHYPVYTGVELEFSNAETILPSEVSYLWHIDTDHSIRGPHPRELTFAGALPPTLAEAAILALPDMGLGGFEINNTCGAHVHVDVRDLTASELRNVLFLYLVVERTLYRYCGAGREASNFCVPLSRTLSEVFAPFLRSEVPDIPNNIRYCGLNLAAVRKFGSIEFRMHPASKVITDIINWVNICCAIKVHGRKYHTAKDVYRRCLLEPEEFLRSVFGDLVDLLYVDGTTKEELLEGIMDAKDSYLYEDAHRADQVLRTSKSRSKSEFPFDTWKRAAARTESGDQHPRLPTLNRGGY